MALTTYILLDCVEAYPVNGLEPIEVAEGESREIQAEESFQAFRKIGAVNAHSTEQALRKAAEEHGSGYYVAVSERSWATAEFEVETVTKVRAKSS